MSGQLVLVSGASGYVGSHVIKQLLERGFRVRGTVRSLNNAKKVEFLRSLCPEAADNLELVEADLSNKDSWTAAAEGCDLCCHVASPFPPSTPRDEQEVIRPAVEGTTNVLTACANAGVKRVVLTSSYVAIGYDSREDKVFTEQDWMDEQGLPPYPKSKLLAERAAWDLQASLPEDSRFELCTVNPVFVMGPGLSSLIGTSQEVFLMLLEKKQPATPDLIFPVVDVRDVANAHVVALEPDRPVDGKRFLLYARDLHMRKDMARVLKQEFGPLGYSIPTGHLPKFMLRVASLCDKNAREIVSRVGKFERIDNSATNEFLGLTYIDGEKTLIDMGHAAIRLGMAKKTKAYAAYEQQQQQQ